MARVSCGRLSTAFLFSGHGGQNYHMARPIYETHAGFRRAMDELDVVMAAQLGRSVLDRLYDPNTDAATPLSDFAIAHPALYMVQYALARVLIERFGPPDFVLGASLGELVAATVSGALTPEQAAAILAQHIETFGRPQGGMIAILARPGILHGRPELARLCEIVSVSPPSHFVVAAATPELCAIEAMLRRESVDFVRLAVGQAFHSSHIDGYRHRLTVSPPRPYAALRTPMVSCATAGRLDRFCDEHIWRSIRQPIRAMEALEHLAGHGPLNFVDLGPGATLAALVARRPSAFPESRVLPVLTPFGRDRISLDRVEAALAQDVLPMGDAA